MESGKPTAGSDKKGAESKKVTREEKQRDLKMDDQIEKLIKSLGSATTSDQKIAILAKNLLELEKEHHKQSTSLKQNEKHFEVVQREKEHLQKEYNKGVLIRDKLEQVCREQQKLMKSIKSESLSKIRDEEEKRKETQAHFQQSINEIFTTLGKNNEENTKLKEANLEMTKKFKYLAEQYELREKQLEKIHEKINLETQLNEAKLAKVKIEATIDKEILLKEKEAVLEDLLSTKKTIVDMQTREKILKDQLNLYTEKYEDFQSSLKKSNDIFTTYKSEIEKMAKKTKALEKECYDWRVKYEKSNKAILEMASDKQAQDQYVGKASRQLSQLQKLCRTLQAERGALLQVLQIHNIERPAMPELPPEPTDIKPPPKSADKLEIMSRNCSDLKKTLAQLQGQMMALTAEKNKPEEVVNKKGKSKKNKSKVCPIKERNPTSCSEEKLNSKRTSLTETTSVEMSKMEQIAERILKEGDNIDGINGVSFVENNDLIDLAENNATFVDKGLMQIISPTDQYTPTCSQAAISFIEPGCSGLQLDQVVNQNIHSTEVVNVPHVIENIINDENLHKLNMPVTEHNGNITIDNCILEGPEIVTNDALETRTIELVDNCVQLETDMQICLAATHNVKTKTIDIDALVDNIESSCSLVEQTVNDDSKINAIANINQNETIPSTTPLVQSLQITSI